MENFGGWLLDVLLTLAALPVIAAAAFAAMRAYRTYHPPRLPFRKKPSDFALSPLSARIPTTHRGILLDAWLFPAHHTAPIVIVGHGVGQHKGFSLPYVALLHGAGYNVLAFDHRNHGCSDTDYVFWRMSRRFTDDMQAAIAFARRQPAFGGSTVALLTFSFSTFPALYVLNRPDCRVDAIICDSGPSLDVKGLPDRFLEAGRITLPRIFKGPILYHVLKATYRWAVNAMLSVEWPPDLSRLEGKLLLIANEEDTLIAPGDVKGIADLCPGAELWVAPGTGHLMALRRRKREYTELVLGFLGRVLVDAPAGQQTIVPDRATADFTIATDWSLP